MYAYLPLDDKFLKLRTIFCLLTHKPIMLSVQYFLNIIGIWSTTLLQSITNAFNPKAKCEKE